MGNRGTRGDGGVREAGWEGGSPIARGKHGERFEVLD